MSPFDACFYKTTLLWDWKKVFYSSLTKEDILFTYSILLITLSSSK